MQPDCLSSHSRTAMAQDRIPRSFALQGLMRPPANIIATSLSVAARGHSARTRAAPWAYESDNPAWPRAGSPQNKIAALEWYATKMLVYEHIQRQDALIHVQLTLKLATDNCGNAYQVTNHKAKNQSAAAML